jgi:RimJ/RimL family protein N-acetyltransferase
MPTGEPIPFPDPPLGGVGFVLRAWSDDDTAGYRAAIEDPQSVRFLNDYGAVSAADAERERSSGEMLVLTIADTADNGFLGFVALIMRPHRVAELAYLVAPEARGRGLAPSAVRLLGDWAFTALGLERLQLRIAPDNTSSQRVAERCGYRFEGVLRSDFELRGKRQDSGMYSLLPTD